MIYKLAGMFCDLAQLLIAAAVFFGCLVSPPSVDDGQHQAACAMIGSDPVTPRRSFAYLRRAYQHLVAGRARLEMPACLARPGNSYAVAESADRFLFTNYVNFPATEIQHQLW